MLRQLLGCAAATGLWLMAAAVGRAAITQEGGVSITPGLVQVGLFPTSTPPVPSDGKLWVTSPSAVVSTTLNIGTPPGPPSASGAVYVRGGTMSHAEGVYVGRGGNGRLEISDGGVVTGGAVRIGGDLNSTQFSPQGVATIHGPGSKLRYTDLAIGASSDGQLLITGGGEASSQLTTQSAPAMIARTSGSTGLAVIDGAGSLWQHGGDIAVGNAGPGTMRITNGGVVISTGGRVGGESLLSFGSVAIDGAGSRWTVNTLTLAGQSSSSSGEITVTNGGILEQAPQSQKAVIGARGYGRVVVSGAGSRWVHPGAPQLGSAEGTGEVFLENGTQFTSAGADMAAGNGRFVVRGPTTRWTSTSTITLGKSQGIQASLELLDGATLSLPTGSILDIGVNGRLILDNGRVVPPSTRFGFTNAGLVQGSGVIQGSGVTNNGRVLVGPGQRLQIGGRFTHSPAGVIEVNDGELALGSFDSSVGSRVIASGATLRASGELAAWTSRGTTTFAHGRNRVFGQYFNSGATIVASGAEAEFYDSVSNLGTLSVAAGGKLTAFGALRVNGVGGAGDVFLEGLVVPSSSLGAMNFGGNVHLGGASRLEIDLNGVANDSLNVSGLLSLGGALQLRAVGELLTPSMMLPIVHAGELSGVFSSLPAIGATIGAGVRFHGVTYDYAHDEVLVSLTQGLAGDLNVDGALSGLDFLAWQQVQGVACEPGMGADANCDGVVDGADLAVWRTAVAAAAASQSAVQQAVPEPASGAMAAVLALSFAWRRRSGVTAA